MMQDIRRGLIAVMLSACGYGGCAMEPAADDAASSSGGAPSTGGVLSSTGATGGLPAGTGGFGTGGTGSGGVGSGGESSGGQPSSGGAATFDPCPAAEPCKVLPLGDSITFGLGLPGGGAYRIELFALAVADGKSMTFVGSQSNGPDTVAGKPFPKEHDGYSGFTIQQIADMIPDKLAPAPHIVLVHLGTNDMYLSPAGAEQRLGALIDEITTALPDSLLVVSTIIPFPGNPNVDAFNAALPAQVDARKAAGKHVLLVDQFTGFPVEELLEDKVHPDVDGYARMAGVWYAAIAPYLH